MSVDGIGAERVLAALHAVAAAMIAAADRLTAADRMGDADHGAAMKRGFAAAQAALDGLPPQASIGEQLTAVGTALMTKAGGASGAVFGTLFRAMGRTIADAETLTTDAIAGALGAGLADVTRRGGARAGDKTMVDALIPAAEAAERCRERGDALATTLPAVAGAAETGRERTKEMVARTGKAKTLGDRALGHVDPGALSLSIILRTLAEALTASESA